MSLSMCSAVVRARVGGGVMSGQCSSAGVWYTVKGVQVCLVGVGHLWSVRFGGRHSLLRCSLSGMCPCWLWPMRCVAFGLEIGQPRCSR